MKRLVYSPKVYAFVKTDSGIIDLSPFITDCSVNRQVNQVSTASVTFRNPGRRFTNGKNGPTFHPMDPIVIFMKRLHNRPVQVFTGYCDTTPYYQLRPGQATISASCTLKRLLHTYWDPGLPFVSRVLQQRGWAMYNGSLGNVAAGISNGGNDDGDDGDPGDRRDTDDRNENVVPATDGSIGALLYDVLLYIGNWHPDTIYIENLPEDLYEGAEALLGDINEANKEAQQQWKQLMKQIIGDGGTYGGGGGNFEGTISGGNLTVKGAPASAKQRRVARQIIGEAYTYDPPQRAIVALLCAATHESVMGTIGMDVPVDHDSIGILQGRLMHNDRADLLDIGYNVRKFFEDPWTVTPYGGAIRQAHENRSIGDICTTIQGNATGDVYTQWKQEALDWIQAYKNQYGAGTPNSSGAGQPGGRTG
jgi:hypothetical protein